MRFDNYRNWLNQFIDHTKFGFIELDISQCMPTGANLCRKHSMAVTQQLLYRRIDQFLVRPDVFYQLLPSEVAEYCHQLEEEGGFNFMIPIKIEDLFTVRQRIIYVKIVQLNNLIDYLSILANSAEFTRSCVESYAYNYSCMWCHRSWISQSVCMINKRNSSLKSGQQVRDKFRINVVSINEFIRCQPPELSDREKLSIIQYGLDYFTPKNCLNQYRQIIRKIWEDSNREIETFHRLLNKEQRDWLSKSTTISRAKKRPKQKSNKKNNYQNCQNNYSRHKSISVTHNVNQNL